MPPRQYVFDTRAEASQPGVVLVTPVLSTARLAAVEAPCGVYLVWACATVMCQPRSAALRLQIYINEFMTALHGMWLPQPVTMRHTPLFLSLDLWAGSVSKVEMAMFTLPVQRHSG